MGTVQGRDGGGQRGHRGTRSPAGEGLHRCKFWLWGFWVACAMLWGQWDPDPAAPAASPANREG